MGSVGLQKSGFLPDTQGTIFRTPNGVFEMQVVVNLWSNGAGVEMVEFWIQSDAFPTARKEGQVSLSPQLPQAELAWPIGMKATETLLMATTTAATVEYTLKLAEQDAEDV